MACSSCQARANMVGNSTGSYIVPTVPQTCDYTLNSLNTLLPLVTPNETSVVQSQINMYTTNCHYLRAVVLPLFNKYTVALNL